MSGLVRSMKATLGSQRLEKVLTLRGSSRTISCDGESPKKPKGCPSNADSTSLARNFLALWGWGDRFTLERYCHNYAPSQPNPANYTADNRPHTVTHTIHPPPTA